MAAREVIADPDKWCRKFREDGDGRHCAMGALDAVRGRIIFIDSLEEALLGQSAIETAPELKRVFASCAGKNIPIVVSLNNDHPDGHSAVMKMFDRAIELSLAEDFSGEFPHVPLESSNLVPQRSRALCSVDG